MFVSRTLAVRCAPQSMSRRRTGSRSSTFILPSISVAMASPLPTLPRSTGGGKNNVLAYDEVDQLLRYVNLLFHIFPRDPLLHARGGCRRSQDRLLVRI